MSGTGNKVLDVEFLGPQSPALLQHIPNLVGQLKSINLIKSRTWGSKKFHYINFVTCTLFDIY